MTLFTALEDLTDNPANRAVLEQAFSNIVVATTRERAIVELTELGSKVDAAIVGVKERITDDVLAQLPRLRVLGSLSVGTDHLDLSALAERRIQVVTAPGANAVSVAEHALMMMLALAKQAIPGHAAVLSGKDRAGLPAMPMELRGRRVGVLGAGATAQALMPMLRALGMGVMAWTRRPEAHQDIVVSGLDEIFRSCEIISVHLPLTPQTRGMVNLELLRLLPKNAIVINVARKEIIDSNDLEVIVRERPDLRFGVDDFGLAADGTVDTVGERGLWSPHIAGVSTDALAAMGSMVCQGVVHAVTNQQLP